MAARLRVKTAAYRQNWPQKDSSKIVFSGLRARPWDDNLGYHGLPTYRADLYVFCVQIEQEDDRWDALDLDQWRFYVMLREELARLGCNSVTLGTIRSVCQPLAADGLRREAGRAIELVAKNRAREAEGKAATE